MTSLRSLADTAAPAGHPDDDRGPVASSARFRLLGPFEVWRDGHRVSVGGRQPERLLACLLAEAGHVVPVGRLIDAVWGDEPPQTAAHQVRKMVASVRRALADDGTLLATDGPGYRVVVDDDQVDVTEFACRVAAAAATPCPTESVATLRSALALWRGPALSGMTGQVLTAAALVLNDRRLIAVERLAEACLASGRPNEAAADLAVAVDEHPLRENLRYLLVLALYRSGRQADAYGVYEDGRRLLDAELGVTPGPELTRLHERMLHNDPELRLPGTESAGGEPVSPADPEPTWTVGSALPYDTPDFTGRHTELAVLSSIVPAASRQAVIIVTVDGMAGVGKTALAVHAAHRLVDRFPDGQLFLDLLGTRTGHPLSALDALERLLRTVGVPAASIPVGLDDRSALWRATVAERSILLLLDNAHSTAQVRPLLPGRPGSVVIVTSRAKLIGLDGAVPIPLAPPSREGSLAIARRVLGAARVEAEPEAVDELLAVCGDLPLAVRIAAARLQARPQWTVEHLLTRLRDAEHTIDELAVGDRSVEAAFRLTYEALGADHRRLFRRLGLLPVNDFTAQTAAAVSGLSPSRTETLLEELLDARLLDQRSVDRYRLHDLLRGFAQAMAQREDSVEQCRAAVVTFYASLVAAVRRCVALVEPGWTPMAAAPSGTPVESAIQDAGRAADWLDAEIDNVVAAVQSAGCLDVAEYGAVLGTDVSAFLDTRCRWAVQVELLRPAVEHARVVGDRDLELAALVAQFTPLWRQGRTAEATDCAEVALPLARALGNRRFEAICLSNTGTLLRAFGHYRQALDYHLRAIRMHRENGSRHHETSALLSLGLVYGALGEHRSALESAQDALHIMDELGSAERAVVPLVNIGIAQSSLGKVDDAEATLRTAVDAAREAGTPHGLALAEVNLARVLLQQGRVDDALERSERARLATMGLDSPGTHADVEMVRGRIHVARGAWDVAAIAYECGLGKAREVNDRGQQLAALTGLIEVRLATGEHDAAERLQGEATEVARLAALGAGRQTQH